MDMASGGDFPELEHWTYSPLKDREIRLISVTPEPDRFGLYQCKLQHFDLHRWLEYSAISYVWGDPEAVGFISVNGKKLRVAKNLLEILEQIKDGRGWFWI